MSALLAVGALFISRLWYMSRYRVWHRGISSHCKCYYRIITTQATPGMKPLSCPSQLILWQQGKSRTIYRRKTHLIKCSTLEFERHFVYFTYSGDLSGFAKLIHSA